MLGRQGSSTRGLKSGDVANELTSMGVIQSVHHVDAKTLDAFLSSYQPVFFLNTGRSGSAFLDKALGSISGIASHHEAFPNLMMFPNYAFHNPKETRILRKVFEAARLELMLDAFLKQKIFVETNHCLVFFAYQIKEVFPKAKFVHLVRHPGDFVRSGIMKGWHKNDSIWENNRIRLADDNVWGKMTQLERLAWTWVNTHQFIEEFKGSFAQDVITVKLEELTSSDSKFAEVISFIDPNLQYEGEMLDRIRKKKVNELYIGPNEPPNMFKLSSYPKYQDWETTQKRQLAQYCGELAAKYGYSL